MFKLGLILVAFCTLACLCGFTQSKVFTTDDAIVYEDDPPEKPGPSLFDHHDGTSDPPKVKRGNTNQRYYELVDDEVIVFEPSPMGMKPFMEALFPQDQQRQNAHSLQRPHPHPQQKMQQFFGKYNNNPHPHVHAQTPLKSTHHHPHPPKISFTPEIPQPVAPREAAAAVLLEATSALDDCVSANDKRGQCVPFRICYPVVFNMVDGQLRNPGLAKILYHASGPCDSRSDGWGSKGRNLRLDASKGSGKESDFYTDIPSTFYNDTVCCPGYHLISNTQESKTMKPSQPDPRIAPPEFQDIEQYQSQIPAADTDYYVDEYDDFEFYTTTSTTTTEKPQTTTKKPALKNSNNKNSTKSASTSNSGKIKSSKGSERTKKDEQSTIKAESNISEVKVESSSSPKSNAKGGEKSYGDKLNAKGNININLVSRTEGPVPHIVPPPHLSAWNCPGRQMGMPRGQWPWMVALLNDGSHFCSGALIDHRHILTSASCVASFQGKDIGRIRVILGDRVMYSSIDGHHMWRKVLRITRHILFNPSTMEHDIAMLEMDTPVTYTPNIQPINLPASGNRSHATKAIISGWSGPDIGKRIFAARSTNDAVMEFMDSKECRRDYDGFVTGGVPQDVICTKPSNTSCMADLGAPLMMKTGNCWHIIGILSHGLGCGTFPDIFTDTAKHIPWIQKNIRHHNILVK